MRLGPMGRELEEPGLALQAGAVEPLAPAEAPGRQAEAAEVVAMGLPRGWLPYALPGCLPCSVPSLLG